MFAENENDEKVQGCSTDAEIDRAVNRLFIFVFTSISVIITLSYCIDLER